MLAPRDLVAAPWPVGASVLGTPAMTEQAATCRGRKRLPRERLPHPHVLGHTCARPNLMPLGLAFDRLSHVRSGRSEDECQPRQTGAGKQFVARIGPPPPRTQP